MLLAYCDASTKGNRAVATTLIMTEDVFIKKFSKRYKVKSSTQAELFGVLQTVEYITQLGVEGERVVLFIDNRSIALQFISVLGNWSVPNNIEDKEIYHKLLDMCKKINISIQHIRGHQHTHNPNKVCDIISHLAVDEVK